MYTSLEPIIGWLVLLGTCLYAWFKGAAPERIGAALLLLGTIAALLFQTTMSETGRVTPTLIGEGLLAMGFLILAIRYASLWLGGAMILQGIQFSLHAFYIVMERSHDWLFAAVTNLVTFGIIGCILLGTTLAWRRARAAQA
jgi:hypothetical protein